MANGEEGKHSEPNNPSGIADSTKLLPIACEILDKQYRNYNWNDEKMSAVITADSILFAAVGFLFSSGLNDLLAAVLLLAAMATLSISIFLCLVHAVPRTRSGKAGPSGNPRTMVGIASYENWQRYANEFCGRTEDNFLQDTLRQVFGMCANNWRSHRLLRSAVICTASAVAMLVVATVAIAFSVRGVHTLGVWQPAPSDTVGVERFQDNSRPGGAVTRQPTDANDTSRTP